MSYFLCILVANGPPLPGGSPAAQVGGRNEGAHRAVPDSPADLMQYYSFVPHIVDVAVLACCIARC